MRIRKYTLTLTLTGAEGSVQSGAPIFGRLKHVHIDYTDISEATTDVTITALAPSLTLLTVANNTTDGWYHPRVLCDGVDGADLTGWYDTFVLSGYVTVAAAQSDAGTITVTLLVEE
jgi:hypothetical protein